MMISAVLSNPDHPDYGVVTIPFPIPHDQYAHCMEFLEALEVGDAVKADCKVEKIDSFYSVLKRMEMLTVNVDELNYLAKLLERFNDYEATQFQAMAQKLELFTPKDFINLNFCCQQVTVITDFSDLAAVGRNHYMNLHGGSAPIDELNALDGEKVARQLIENGGGTITPYGVVYDNGMKLKQVYPNLAEQDTQYIPKSIEDNGRTLTLTDIQWQTDNTANMDGYAVGDRFTAVATYTGSATSSYVKGYTVTADYTGTVSRIALNRVRYVAIFEGTPIQPAESTEGPSAASVFRWSYVLLPLGLVAAAGAGVGGALLVKRRHENAYEEETSE